MQSIKIKKGKIFIQGNQTTNPELIGLAILDFLEKGNKITIKKKSIKK